MVLFVKSYLENCFIYALCNSYILAKHYPGLVVDKNRIGYILEKLTFVIATL